MACSWKCCLIGVVYSRLHQRSLSCRRGCTAAPQGPPQTSHSDYTARSRPSQTKTAQPRPLPSGTSSIMPATLSKYCQPAFVSKTINRLVDSIATGDSATAVAKFSPHLTVWDVYLTVPGQVGGPLRTSSDIAAFVDRLHARGEVWKVNGIDPPSGSAGMPGYAAYGVSVTIPSRGWSDVAMMKVVMGCTAGHTARRWTWKLIVLAAGVQPFVGEHTRLCVYVTPRIASISNGPEANSRRHPCSRRHPNSWAL